MNNQSKIYIAGDTGMVGSALLRNLMEKGFANFVLRTIEELDLTNQEHVSRFFSKEKPEYVFLAAAKVGGIVANNTFRAQFIYENLMIQNNVIHQSYLHGVKKLLFLGSSCIYPKHCPQPIKEEYLLTGPLEETNEPYAIAKISGIKMCENYHRQYGCNFISVMPTNLYGPNDNYNLETSHVVPALLRKFHLAKCLEQNDWTAIRKDLTLRPIGETNGNSSESRILQTLSHFGILSDNSIVTVILWGTGNVFREFMHVDDMVEACLVVMAKLDINKSQFINIGLGKDQTIQDIAHIIKGITGFSGPIRWDHVHPDGTPRKLLNVDKLHDMGFIPKYTLESGLKSVYKVYLQK